MMHKHVRKEPKLPPGKLSLVEAAEYLEVSRHKVSRLLKKGVLKGEKYGLDERVTLIDIHDLQQLKEGPNGRSDRSS
ncbi:MAG TPA: helix-turn-helix domain-containing protein [Blastocatellia bacterium]|nr:helix-turn-helix domain-containing protein [Blastocatellia bacterium]